MSAIGPAVSTDSLGVQGLKSAWRGQDRKQQKSGSAECPLLAVSSRPLTPINGDFGLESGRSSDIF